MNQNQGGSGHTSEDGRLKENLRPYNSVEEGEFSRLSNFPSVLFGKITKQQDLTSSYPWRLFPYMALLSMDMCKRRIILLGRTWANYGCASRSSSCIKPGIRGIICLDELSCEVRLERRTTEQSSSRQIFRLVPA